MVEAIAAESSDFSALEGLHGWRPRGAQHIAGLLEQLGEDPSRSGLVRTPERAWRSLMYLTEGYDADVADTVGDALFDEPYDELITVRDVEFYSLCEHHMLPFFGHAYVGYVPDGRIVGLSKLPRVIDVFSRRLQVQERLTMQIADALEALLRPRGVAVVLEASHLCMMMRGVQKQNSRTVTSAMRGILKTDSRMRNEFLEVVARS